MTTSKMLTIIREARQLLSERWIPWVAGDGKGGHCHVGCLWVAAGVQALGFNSLRHRPRYIIPEGDLSEEPPGYVDIAEDLSEEPRRYVDDVARDLHPELIGCRAARTRPFGTSDDFDRTPGLFVNNHLGKEAILAVYDEAIARLEVAALCEEEAAKLQFAAAAPEVEISEVSS